VRVRREGSRLRLIGGLWLRMSWRIIWLRNITLSIVFIRKLLYPKMRKEENLTKHHSEMLVANYFPKMMSKAAGFLQAQAPPRRRISGSAQQEQSLLD
jgi:hypothetical protein